MVKIIRKYLWQYRQLTSCLRMRPDFLIVGAMKCGTTSLYHYLSQHPQLTPSYIKEIRFFCDSLHLKPSPFEKGEAWYRAHFPLQTKANNLAFEASGYIFHPSSAQRIFAANPKMKIILILRNPTERAISHYFHVKRQGRESLPIMQALQADEPLQVVNENKWGGGSPMVPTSLPIPYKKRGLYAPQIERFLNYFPTQKILILSSEALLKWPAWTLKEVFTFVGVDAAFVVKDLTAQNIANNKTTVDVEVRDYLDRYFAPHNQALYKLINKDFGW